MQLTQTEAHDHGDRSRLEEHPGTRLDCMQITREIRTARIELASGRQITIDSRQYGFTRDQLADFAKRSGLTQETIPRLSGDLLEVAEGLIKPAAHVLRVQGFHAPMVFLFDAVSPGPPVIRQFGRIEDRQLRQVVMHDVASEVLDGSFDGIIFIGEIPVVRAPGLPPDIAGTLVVAAAGADGRRRTYRIAFSRGFRSGAVLVGKPTVELGAVPEFLIPVISIWDMAQEADEEGATG
jgi:hypothetical protein